MTQVAVSPNQSTRTFLLALLTPLLIVGAGAGCAEGVTSDPPPNTCGDGVVGGDEACDDGDENGDAPDACRADCTKPRCGDGIVDGGETCDDANEEGGDGCVACEESYVCGDDECSKDQGESCSLCADDCCPCGDAECTLGEVCGQCPQDCCPLCGNGELDAGEGCDDGNIVDGDGCAKGCTDEDGQATCGNSIIETGEDCDDGNTTGSDGCGTACELEYVCGDAVCEGNVGENCVTCASDCCPNCGDGVINDAEQCDGSVPPGVETCQDQCYPGGTPSCTSCLLDYTTCQGELPECGNGTIECGEECDDAELGGLSCDSLGYDGGDLGCTASCAIDIADCGELLHYYRQDFDEGCPAGWTIAFPWQCGAPTGGPAAAYSAPNVLSTGLAGNYTANASPFTAHVTSPAFNLSQAVNPSVSFKMWHDFGTSDGVQVLASTDGTNFTAISQVSPAYSGGTFWTGDGSGWRDFSASLSAYAGESEVYVRFGLQSDSSVSGEQGAFIDDVLVAETCGNGVLDPGELCDAEAMGPTAVCPNGTCGVPACAADCQSFDVDACTTPDCGNGVRECAEACDGNDFDGGTCNSYGYDGGTLDCTASCQLDVDGCGALLELLPVESFETCPPAGWTLTGTWQCGVPTSGPNSAATGTRVVATNLAGDYASGLAWASNYVQTPAFMVNGPSPILSFMMWLRTENSFDGVRLEASTDGGSTWSIITGVSPAYTDDSVGSSVAWDDTLTAWSQYVADLSPYLGQEITVRFSFFSDGSAQYPGAYIDDVQALPSASALPVVIGPTPAPFQVLPPSMVSVQLGTTSPGAVAWSIVDETNGAWLSIDQTGLLTGDSSLAMIGPGSVTVRAYRVDNPANFDEVTVEFSVADVFWGETFEPCPADWTYTGDWECADPSSGPANAYSGTNAVGTNTYTNGRSWGSSVATSPVISLAGAVNPGLSFRFWQDLESCCDGTHLEISVNGGAWQVVTNPVPAYSASTIDGQATWPDYAAWTEITADLSAYAGQDIQLRWTMRTDGSVTYPGPFVDDVVIVSE